MRKPYPPLWHWAIAIAMHAAIWAYPVASGGAGNLLVFAVWVLALVFLVGSVSMLFAGPQEERWHRPLVTKWAFRLSIWGALASLIYAGHFGLAGVFVAGSSAQGLAKLVHREEGQPS